MPPVFQKIPFTGDPYRNVAEQDDKEAWRKTGAERRFRIGVGSTSSTVRQRSPAPKSRGVKPVGR